MPVKIMSIRKDRLVGQACAHTEATPEEDFVNHCGRRCEVKG